MYKFDFSGNEEKHHQYKTAFVKRLDTINAVFWDPKECIWFDLDLDTKDRRSQFYPSNVFPLLMYHHTNNSEEVLAKLEDAITYLKVPNSSVEKKKTKSSFMLPLVATSAMHG